ncbi:MAG: low molecular weight protein-tyrosine phosphatase [Pseudonocardiales bacterium]|nr:low molecular weight protein-tyrosine phosphatase [Pseudonocardiales bacterium]
MNKRPNIIQVAILGKHSRGGTLRGGFPEIIETVWVSFTVLYVCTGNLCRSPMAELLFRGWADPQGDVTVSSAGTKALVGHGIDHSSAAALGQLGIDPTQHRARQFEPWMAAYSDLILTAAREHRDVVMTALPSVYKRTFTMKEFARLVGDVPAAEPRAIVAAAGARRGHAKPVKPEEDDVADPYRGAIKHAKSIVEEITETVYITLATLGLAAERWGYTPPVRENRSARPAPY